MSTENYTELKRLADAANAVTGDVSVDIAISSEHGPNQSEIDAVTEFVGVATPTVVLALIAENGAMAKRILTIDIVHGPKAELHWIGLSAERDQLKAENEALRKERKGKVLCDLELFQGLRDTASQEAEEHRQHMAAYRPLRQEVLDHTVRQCDALIDAAMGKGEQS